MKAKQKLACLINLINMDIANLNRGDLLKVISDLTELGMGYEYRLFSGISNGKAVLDLRELPDAKKKLQEIHNRLKSFLEKILSTKNRRIGSKDSRFEISFQTKKSIGSSSGSLIVSEEAGRYDLEFDFAKLILECFPWHKNEFGNPEPCISLDDIRQCAAPGCNKYFLRLYKKEKAFCSNKCAWRVYSALRRGAELNSKGKKGGK